MFLQDDLARKAEMQRKADNEERKRNTLRMFDQQMALVNQQRAVRLTQPHPGGSVLCCAAVRRAGVRVGTTLVGADSAGQQAAGGEPTGWHGLAEV